MLHTVRFILLVNALVEAYKHPGAPARLQNTQQQSFRNLLHYAVAHSPFYERRFRGRDLERCPIADLPPFDKKEMMAHFDEVVTDRAVTREGLEKFIGDPNNLGNLYLGRYVPSHTSGSQGQPALILQEPHGVAITLALQMARG